MAKKEVQDFRIDFIEAVARTDNLRVMRTVCGQLTTQEFTANINKIELLKMMEDGIEKVKSLLGDSCEFFTPLVRIKEEGLQSYFEKIADGYKDLKEQNLSKLKLETQRSDLQSKISKYRQKGKNDKVKEFEYKLYCVDFPNENLSNIEEAKERLMTQYQAGTISEEQYESILKDLKKHEKLSLSTLRTLKIMKESENAKFYNLVQEDVRNYLCYLFFTKDGHCSQSPNRFLHSYDGDVKADYAHLLLLYYYLKSINYKGIKEIEGVLYYSALEQFYKDISPFLGVIKGIYLKQSPTEFYSEKHDNYTYGYMPYYLVPKGYRGYIFEPENLAQQSFIAAIDTTGLTVDNMVVRYKKAQELLKGKEDGLFFSFLSRDIENRMMQKIITQDFPIQEMDGEYKDLLYSEFMNRRTVFGDNDLFGVMANMYNRVVKPYALEVLGSYVRTYCANLARLKDKKSIYIYYLSPERIAIAVREDITDEELTTVFDKKFLDKLKLVTKPTLDDIVYGKLL